MLVGREADVSGMSQGEPMRSLPLCTALLLSCAPAGPVDSWLQSVDVEIDLPLDARRARLAGFDASTLAMGARATLDLPLFDDRHERALLLARTDRDGNTTWIGHLEGAPEHTVVLVERGPWLAGILRSTDGDVVLRPHSARRVAIVEIDPRRLAPEHDPIPGPSGARHEVFAFDGADAQIDLLVAYTDLVADSLGGAAGVEVMVEATVAEANLGFDDSAIGAQLALVGVVDSGWDEDGFGWVSSLSALADVDDGALDGVARERDALGADVVSLLVEGDGGSCGVGYLMAVPSAAFAGYAYSVVDHRCASSSLTLAHEIGHNLGAQHDHDNATSSPAYPYAYGFRDVEAGHRSVMAYPCDDGACPRRNRWSDPTARVDGSVFGVDAEADAPAHNVAALRLTADVVAAFRDAPDSGLAFASPEVDATLPPDHAAISWTDAGTPPYELTLGSTPEGADLGVYTLSSTSLSLSGLPEDARWIWARLRDDAGATAARRVRASGDAGVVGQPAELLTPEADATVSGATLGVQWSDVEGERYAVTLLQDNGEVAHAQTDDTWATLPLGGAVRGPATLHLATQIEGRWFERVYDLDVQ